MTGITHGRLPARLILGALALFGAIAAFAISKAQWTGSAPCPSLGFVPACYVVLAGYLLMTLSAIFARGILCLLGWLPVFLLAAIGTFSEIFSAEPVCPQTGGGIPQCFLSIGLVSLIGLAGLFVFKKTAH